VPKKNGKIQKQRRAQFIVPLQKHKSNSDVKKIKKLVKGLFPDK